MAETEDGFRIAEADLRLRGPGDVLGTHQSGLADLRFCLKSVILVLSSGVISFPERYSKVSMYFSL